MPTSNILTLGRDNNGYLNDYFAERTVSDYTYLANMAVDVLSSITVPAPFDCVLFSYSKTNVEDIYVGINAIPTIAGGNDFILLEDGDSLLLEDGDHLLLEGGSLVGSGLALNPKLITVKPGDVINMLSTGTTQVLLSFYARNELNQN